MSADVDYDLLADYVGGALDGTPERERIALLIATSTEWGRAADDLTAALHGVQNDLDVLREAPPEPMPEDVAARIESLLGGARHDPLAPRLVNPDPTSPRAPRKRRLRRWVAPVAIIAAALGFFAIGQAPTLMSPMRDQATSNELSAQAPGAAQVPMPTQTIMTWRMYDRDNLGGAVRSSAGIQSYSENPRAETGKTTDSAAAPPAMQRLIDPLALGRCLNAVAAALPGHVDLIEYAYFESRPALVISITAPDGEWRFVAGANCGQPGPDELFRAPLK